MTSTDIHDRPETEVATSFSPHTNSKVLQTAHPSVTDPFLPGEFPPQESSSHDTDDAGAGVHLEGSRNSTGQAGEALEWRPVLVALPPSPPLTNPEPHKNSHEVLPEPSEGAAEGEGEPNEVDWHPLDHTKSESKDPSQNQDTTIVEESVTHGSDEKHSSVLSPRGQMSNPNLRIVTKAPSPQPWDLVNPPPSNNGDATDYYSTLGTKNFTTLQKKTRSRPVIPQSSYYFGPPSVDTAYGTNPVGHIGIHHPREVFRVERDYTCGELVQFVSTYPLELEGRITPTQFLETINAINELLISAHSIRHSFFNNLLAVFTLQISRLVVKSHYEKEMSRLEHMVQDLNTELYNPVGLNIRWPRKVAFLFLEIEYY